VGSFFIKCLTQRRRGAECAERSAGRQPCRTCRTCRERRIGRQMFTKWRQQWLFVLIRVGRQARIRVRRACRARQGAADAPRRTRRSLKTARDADAADRRRRFDMPCRRSWSRASAKFSAPPRETKLGCQGLRPKVSGSEGKEVKGLGQNPDSPGQRP
jgi:hypothetical protein